MFLELAARPLMIAHALLGSTLVALTTHHLIWIIRSRGARRRGEPRFAFLASFFFLLAFSLGASIYPTYRVRVRAELFESSVAQAAELDARRAQQLTATPSAAPLAFARVVRLFDAKEHLVALGLLASLVLCWVSRRVSPSEGAYRALYLGLACFTCGTSWAGLVIGLYTASIRAVGSLG